MSGLPPRAGLVAGRVSAKHGKGPGPPEGTQHQVLATEPAFLPHDLRPMIEVAAALLQTSEGAERAGRAPQEENSAERLQQARRNPAIAGSGQPRKHPGDALDDPIHPGADEYQKRGQRGDQEPQVEVTLRPKPPAAVVVHVADNGRGITSAQRRKIFGRFVRLGSELERDKPGMGLGLYIVRTLVERLRGRIRVRDCEGGTGTVFEVELPGVGVAAPTDAKAKPPSAEADAA